MKKQKKQDILKVFDLKNEKVAGFFKGALVTIIITLAQAIVELYQSGQINSETSIRYIIVGLSYAFLRRLLSKNN